MDMVPLKASARSSGTKPKNLRKSGQVPCVLYGNDVSNLSLQCAYNDIHKAYARAGRSTLVDLDADGKKVPVLFHKLQFDAVSDRITHVDFYAVDMKKEIEAEVPIRLEGTSPAVEDLGAILITPHDHVMVKCLPSVLPHDIAVNLGKLTEFGSVLTVADLVIPEGVKVVEGPETVLATVQEPREEVIEEPALAEGEEVVVKGGEEGEAKEGVEAEGKLEEDGRKREEKAK